MSIFSIGAEELKLSDLFLLKESGHRLELAEAARDRIAKNHQYLLSKLDDTERAFYGINTGFGSFCTTKISPEHLARLQSNLIRSHAAGAGEWIPDQLVRLMLVLKVQNLSLGYSGVRIQLVEALIALYNQDILPMIPAQGSLGASGDLAPLAHMSLALIGLGDVRYHGRQIDALTALRQCGLQAIALGPKEGLALINGTQFSTAYAVYNCLQASRLTRIADHTLAMSLEAFDGDASPFATAVHRVRAHPGQRFTANRVREILDGSPQFRSGKAYVQDPYSFRCAPQVHGASYDTIRYAETVITTEINSVSDNPLLFEQEDQIISGGNFHAQPIALVLDFMSIAIAELASISERRCFKLLSGERGLQPNLANNPGLESGMMIAQYTAAAIVSQNKQLCTPASVDSIVSSAGQEDHVSMAANAATKCYRVMDNTLTVLAIEFLTAYQALHMKTNYISSPMIEEIRNQFARHMRPFEGDVILSDKFETTRSFLDTYF